MTERTEYDASGLEALVDAWRQAMVDRDPASLPLSQNIKFTENGQRLDIGDGLWATASGVGRHRHYFVDVANGEVGFLGNMFENGRPLAYSLRLRVQLGLITEAETILYRTGAGPVWNDQGIEAMEESDGPAPIWLGEIPEEQRLSRQALIAMANSYFDGLELNDGHGDYPYAEDCDRIENGVRTTNNPELGIGRVGDFNASAMGVREAFETGFYRMVTRCRDRRFLVDERRGAVLSFVIFDHAGTVKNVTLRDGRVLELPFMQRPSSIQLAEAFKIEGGLVRQIVAVGTSCPYGMRPGWEGGASGH